MASRYDWSAAPTITIFVHPPDPPSPCPACGHAKPIISRTEANGDGSSTRKAICRRCSQRFKVAVEIASLGNLHDDDL